MSVSSPKKREAKLKWLFRPLDWARAVCFWGVLVSAFAWFDGDVSSDTIAIFAISVLFITLGLLTWLGIKCQRAARGHY